LHNLALFRVKTANFFAEFFGENILKIITSVPGGSDVAQQMSDDKINKNERIPVHVA
jgi:hypothetical protein